METGKASPSPLCPLDISTTETRHTHNEPTLVVVSMVEDESWSEPIPIEIQRILGNTVTWGQKVRLRVYVYLKG